MLYGKESVLSWGHTVKKWQRNNSKPELLRFQCSVSAILTKKQGKLWFPQSHGLESDQSFTISCMCNYFSTVHLLSSLGNQNVCIWGMILIIPFLCYKLYKNVNYTVPIPDTNRTLNFLPIRLNISQVRYYNGEKDYLHLWDDILRGGIKESIHKETVWQVIHYKIL